MNIPQRCYLYAVLYIACIIAYIKTYIIDCL